MNKPLSPTEDLVLRIIAIANEWGINPSSEQIKIAVSILLGQKLEKNAKFK